MEKSNSRQRLYKQRDWLYQKYIVEELGMWRMANIAGCCQFTVAKWLRKFGIEIRTAWESSIGKYCGENSPSFGLKRSIETRKRMSENHWSKRGILPWNKGLTKEIDNRVALISKRMSGSGNSQYGKRGELCPNWVDGRSSESYGADFGFELKYLIRRRDNFICWGQFCCVKEGKIAHDVHHIDYDKKNNEWWNLITLCKSCHSKTNWNRKFWEKCFKRIMETRDYGYENQIRQFATA